MYMCCLHLKVGFKRALLGVRKTRLLKLKGRGFAKGDLTGKRSYRSRT